MNRYEVWAPWFVLAVGAFLSTSGILCMGLAWGHYATAEAEIRTVHQSASDALAVVDQCADAVEQMRGIIIGPYQPRVILPPAEITELGRGG